VQRFRAGSRASQVKSREKQVGREQKALHDLKRSNIARPFIRFEVKRPSGKQVLNVEHLTKRFGDVKICDEFNLSLFRGDRVALVGRNGIGKTSLMRLFLGEVPPDAGKVEWGYEAAIGYLPQEHTELIKRSKQTAHEWLWSWNEDTDEENLRALFGRLLFTKDEPLKPTQVLSGGETVRLLLARLMLLKSNVLLLDEPTNHLDLEAIRSLTEALARYEGTCVFITHDRQMVSQVATRVLEVSEAGITELSPEQFHEGQFLLGHARYQKQASSW
jgi:ATPase subunit of ABC transporter with duplicated ATPase domains